MGVKHRAQVLTCMEIPYERKRRMLVLSRKKNESIVVDNNIIITVVEIRGDKVRLGIEAPREVGVFRSELTVSASAVGISAESELVADSH